MSLSSLPLYRQIADQILHRYVEGRSPGDRLPAVRDLEIAMGVSFATIRHALKVLEDTGVVERRQGSGTYIRRPSKRAQEVAILLEGDIADPCLSRFYPTILQEVRIALLKQGLKSRPYLGYLQVALEIGEITCREFLDDLKEERICGVIPLFAKVHPTWSTEVTKRGLPVIGEPGGAITRVGVDPAELATAVLKHFKALNKKHVAFLRLPKDRPGSLRYTLAEQAEAVGITVEHFPLPLHATATSDRPWLQLKAALERTDGQPDAIFISDDMLLPGFFHTAGPRPCYTAEDLLVYSSDTVPLASPCDFFHLVYSTQLKAQRIAESMKRSLQGETLPSLIPLPFQLVRREAAKHPEFFLPAPANT